MKIKNIFLRFKNKKNKNTSKEYKIFSATDMQKYKPNEYVLFTEKGVYAHGFNLKKLLKKFEQENPNKRPLIVKIPPKKFTLM